MSPGRGIEAEVVAPVPGASAISKSNELIPLIVRARDTDQLIQRCRCLVNSQRISAADKLLEVVDGVQYKWSLLAGEGRLLGADGPATLFQPPPLEVGKTALATIEARIANFSGGAANADEPVRITFGVAVRRTKESEYESGVQIEKETPLPGVSVTVSTRQGNCVPQPETWEKHSARLPGQARLETLKVRAGERVLFSATGEDSDSLQLQCAGDCGSSRRRVNLIDEPRYTWTARRGSFPDHGAPAVTNGQRTSAVYMAPGERGDDTVEIKIEDTRTMAADDPIVRRIAIKVD